MKRSIARATAALLISLAGSAPGFGQESAPSPAPEEARAIGPAPAGPQPVPQPGLGIFDVPEAARFFDEMEKAPGFRLQAAFNQKMANVYGGGKKSRVTSNIELSARRAEEKFEVPYMIRFTGLDNYWKRTRIVYNPRKDPKNIFVDRGGVKMKASYKDPRAWDVFNVNLFYVFNLARRRAEAGRMKSLYQNWDDEWRTFYPMDEENLAEVEGWNEKKRRENSETLLAMWEGEKKSHWKFSFPYDSEQTWHLYMKRKDGTLDRVMYEHRTTNKKVQTHLALLEVKKLTFAAVPEDEFQMAMGTKGPSEETP